ncbi:hypothetical protein EZS27_012108 [termite gut metagenome]|uniref:Heparinase II/III-like C-terminal domain-containing protein n=1 Tax=termite gut metagenome TaxID=433724 RepID=A0A5J4S1L2_9ZZZZ
MKTKISIVCLFSLVLFIEGWAQERNYLTQKYSKASLQQVLVSQEQFKPYPEAGKKGWEQVPESLKHLYIVEAEKLLGTSWGELKATEFMQFKRTGNRSVFESISFGRRNKLNVLVLGELFEDKGRFIDDIINGIWVICEESWWGVPAHNGRESLPDFANKYVDLFDAETGAVLAWTHYLLKDKLEKVSPVINRRITDELERRIIIPCLKTDYNWMGFHRESLNNWTPWICSNWLTVVLLCDTNPERRLDAVYRIMQSLDHFVNPYPADGGCDEGPGYWDRAGASLYDCLELLYLASKGQVNIFDQPLIKNIGSYIYKVHIADDYYVNFADAGAVIHPSADLVYRYGQSIHDETMIQFAGYLAERQQFGKKASGGSLGRQLPALFHINEMSGKADAPLSREVWFPDLQIAIARSHAHSSQGLYLVAKGGHNAESHNHNDIGNFVVYADGKPVLIDIGVETYTAKTFSSQRYEIWTMQSAYHNLPTINGVQQSPGRQFAAKNVSYSTSNKKVVFSLDIAKAYPENAKVESWKRHLTLNRSQQVDIEDVYSLKECTEPVKWHLMTCIKPDANAPGKILLTDAEKQVELAYDKSQLFVVVEEVSVTDQRLLSTWGNRLYRITLTHKKQELKGSCKISVIYKK